MPQTRSNSYTTAQSLTGASPKEDQPFKKWVKTECSPASLDAANITGEAVGHPADGMNTDQSDQLADDSDQIMDDDDDDLDDDADDEDDDDDDQSVEGDNSPPTRRRNTKPSKTNRRKERDSRREELYPELGNDLTRVQNRLSPNLTQEQFTLIMTLHRFILTRPGTTISRSQFRDAVNVLHRGNGKTSPRRPNRPVSVDPEDTSGGMYKTSWKGPSKTILNSRNGVFNPETGLVKGNHPKGATFIHSDFTATDLGLTQSQWAFLVIPGTPNPWQPGRQTDQATQSSPRPSKRARKLRNAGGLRRERQRPFMEGGDIEGNDKIQEQTSMTPLAGADWNATGISLQANHMGQHILSFDALPTSRASLHRAVDEYLDNSNILPQTLPSSPLDGYGMREASSYGYQHPSHAVGHSSWLSAPPSMGAFPCFQGTHQRMANANLNPAALPSLPCSGPSYGLEPYHFPVTPTMSPTMQPYMYQQGYTGTGLTNTPEQSTGSSFGRFSTPYTPNMGVDLSGYDANMMVPEYSLSNNANMHAPPPANDASMPVPGPGKTEVEEYRDLMETYSESDTLADQPGENDKYMAGVVGNSGLPSSPTCVGLGLHGSPVHCINPRALHGNWPLFGEQAVEDGTPWGTDLPEGFFN